MDNIITLAHGGGGLLTQQLIEKKIAKILCLNFSSPDDSAIINPFKNNIVFTTDSFVVTPIFFPGGDIGRLCVAGTVNDITSMGADCKYLSLSLIIEEGFKIEELEKVLYSIKETCEEANVKIITGDTKVVNRGKGDKIYINTTGIGELKHQKIGYKNIKENDILIVNGDLGDHAITVTLQRNEFDIETNIKSDAAPLNNMINLLFKNNINIKYMRDITRGGLAGALNEISSASDNGFEIYENSLPVNKKVKGIIEILGFDVLNLANEGKMLLVVDQNDAEKCIQTLKTHKYGKNAATIGKVIKEKKVFIINEFEAKRLVDTPYGENLPRIC